MKNLNKAGWTAVFFTSIFLTGCQSTQSVSPDQVRLANLNQEKRIGMIQSLGGAVSSNQATHILKLQDGKTILLKSTQIDLSANKFNNVSVEVSGNLVRTTDGNRIMDVKSIDLLEAEQKAQDTQPQWVEYNSDNFGLSFKYRDDFKLFEHGSDILIKGLPQSDLNSSETTTASATPKEKSVEIDIKLISTDPNFNLIDHLSLASDSNSELLSKGINKSKITVRALDAFKKASNDGTTIDYFIKVNEKTFQISFKADLTTSLVQDQNIFYDILSTINFKGLASVTSSTAESPLNKGIK